MNCGAAIANIASAIPTSVSRSTVNADHQPGVEAGKKAAAAVLGLQHEVVAHLKVAQRAQSADEIAASLGREAEVEAVFKILEHLAANPGRGVEIATPGPPDRAAFRAS